jgi:hypothetical protein
MDVNTILTRVKNTVQGYHQDTEQVLDDALIWHYIDQSVKDIKKEFKRPVKEQDLVMVSGERGLNLPSDWVEFLDEYPVKFIENGSDAAWEGVIFPITENENLDG